jgi:PEP-CTERM motif
MFAPVAFVDWGAPVVGSIVGPPGSNLGGLDPVSNQTWPVAVGTTLNAASNQNTFTITSNDQFLRADNTEMAWDGSNWTPAMYVNSSNIYFGGHFGAPSAPSAQPQFGDNLLGAFEPAGTDNGPPEITLSFSQTLSYISFQVSSASNANFTAELLAFDMFGQQIGTYMIADTGGGGNCAGLAATPPQPCNDAALIQFYDPGDKIASVELIMLDDPTGVLIDELGVASIPEPGSWTLFALGLALILWAKRKQIKFRSNPTENVRSR